MEQERHPPGSVAAVGWPSCWVLVFALLLLWWLRISYVDRCFKKKRPRNHSRKEKLKMVGHVLPVQVRFYRSSHRNGPLQADSDSTVIPSNVFRPCLKPVRSHIMNSFNIFTATTKIHKNIQYTLNYCLQCTTNYILELYYYYKIL